jgi:hypothetical protein
VISNLLLIFAGLVGACCFFGAAFYLMSVANEIKFVKKKTLTVAEAADPIGDLHRIKDSLQGLDN